MIRNRLLRYAVVGSDMSDYILPLPGFGDVFAVRNTDRK